jgi:hypothetical protein
MEKKRNTNKILLRKPECNRLLRTSRCKWEYKAKINLMEIGWETAGWIQLAQDTNWWRVFVNMIMNLQVP